MNMWFIFLAGPNSLQDIREMLDPIRECFDGIVVTYHGSREDPEAQYLEEVKKSGAVIYLPYSGRHDFSRNACLFCGPIKQGDWVCTADTLEHPNHQFIEKHIPYLITQSNAIYYFYGKPFLFQFHESMRYEGTPHESLRRLDGLGRSVELNQMWPNEADVRLNVRPRKRDKWHFLKHYGRYALLPWGSNHYILPLNGKPNAEEIFRKRELARMAFIDLLRELNIKRDVDSIIEYMKGEMDPRFVAHIEADKVWNDIYRFFILKREDFMDNHDWSDLVRIHLDSPPQSS